MDLNTTFVAISSKVFGHTKAIVANAQIKRVTVGLNLTHYIMGATNRKQVNITG